MNYKNKSDTQLTWIRVGDLNENASITLANQNAYKMAKHMVQKIMTHSYEWLFQGAFLLTRFRFAIFILSHSDKTQVYTEYQFIDCTTYWSFRLIWLPMKVYFVISRIFFTLFVVNNISPSKHAQTDHTLKGTNGLWMFCCCLLLLFATIRV